jgi:predicted transporter
VRFAKFFQHARLETGLIVGMALFLVGVGMWVAGLRYWSSMHFGPLNPTSVLRIVIPGILCLTLGFQIILSSFFLSVLSMERQDR